MDVQTENVDPPPCESQPSGKIRKGFKLFGKRKPGNIFSIRSKGDGNNKSPIARSKTLDGLTETTAPDSEQEPEKEKEQEASQGESGQAEEEPVGEDGVLAAAPPRTSISSATSARSLSFLSLLRGGRRGGGERQVQTVSQPAGRQRRGLKSLFGSVRFRQRDKDDKEEAPPSPLLMSSRTNSVEIIKEDLTLTPKSQPRSLDSPETESCEPAKSVTTQGSSATTPSETIAPQMTAGNVSKTNEHVPPLPTTPPPLEPGENSLSCLLADISSLLTFDSISGGGDIIADAEAEWGKASRALGTMGTGGKPLSKTPSPEPILSSSLTSTLSISTTTTAKPSPFTARTTSSFQSFTPTTKPTVVCSPVTPPSSTITFSTKSSTLAAQSVKSGADLTPVCKPSATTTTITTTTAITIKSTPTPTATTKPFTSSVTVTSFSIPLMSSPPITMKSTPYSSSVITTATPKPPATEVKTQPSAGLTFTSMAGKSATENAAVTQLSTFVSKPSAVAAPPSASAKPTPVTHSPPTPVAFTHPPASAKLDSSNVFSLQSSLSPKPLLSSVAGDAKAPVTSSPACTVPSGLTSPASGLSAKMPVVTTSTPAPGSLTMTTSDSIHPPGPSTLNKPLPSLVTIPDPVPKPTTPPISLSKPQPSPAPEPTHTPISLDKIRTTTAPSPAPLSLDKRPPAAPVPEPAPAPVSLDKPHTTTTPAAAPVSLDKRPPASPAPEPTPTPISLDKIRTTTTATAAPVTVDKMPPASTVTSTPTPHAAVSSPAPSPMPTAAAPAPAPVSLPKTPSATATAPCPASSPAPPSPAPLLGEAATSAKTKVSRQASVDGQSASPSSVDTQGARTTPPKTAELQNEPRTTPQGPTRERKTPPAKTPVSKIPVVGGGRAGKLPVRENQHTDDDGSWDPPTPVLEEERPHLHTQHGGSKDKVGEVEASVPTLKHAQEESQQPHPPKVITSVPRDSKIPVKHGAQSHSASQIPQAKEPPRTKIPVSKVPVRRIATKPTAAGSSGQMRK